MVMKEQIPTFACVLRSGGDYRPLHADCLMRQIERCSTVPYRFLCLTDFVGADKWFPSLPLEFNYPGWWSCVELWKLKGPVVVAGLDTLIMGNIDGLFQFACSLKQNQFGLLDSPFHPNEFVNGIQVWNGDFSWLLERFNFEEIQAKYRGDENYLIESLQKKGIELVSINDHFGGIYNYKMEYLRKKIVGDPKILYFHGKPRPWNVANLWRKYGQ